MVEIVGGDLLRLDGGRLLRLAGIEIAKRRSEGDEAASGAVDPGATAALTELTGGGIAFATVGAGMDRYGRIPAQIMDTDGVWLQRMLVTGGLARVRPREGEYACLPELLRAEAAAREATKGLWTSPDYAVTRADDPSLSGRSSLYAIVEGRVVSVGHGTRMVFLDFGHDFRRDFTVMVPLKVAERFDLVGTPVDGLEGRRIRVRGIIEESGGPAIRVSDPIEIELVDEGDAGGAGK